VRRKGRSQRCFKLFQAEDLGIFLAIARGEFAISRLRNVDLDIHIEGDLATSRDTGHETESRNSIGIDDPQIEPRCLCD